MKLHLILNEYLEYAQREIVSIDRTRSSVSSLTRHLGITITHASHRQCCVGIAAVKGSACIDQPRLPGAECSAEAGTTPRRHQSCARDP